jgi:hypothetical protein
MLSSLDQEWTPEGVDVDVTKKNDNLQDSEMTTPTETGSVSEDESNAGFFSFAGMGTDFKNLAFSISPAIEGIAKFVHRSALNVAAEIAQMERDGEIEAEHWREENHSGNSNVGLETSLCLPWEIRYNNLGDSTPDAEPVYVTDQDLMEIVMALSLKESTYLEPFPPAPEIDAGSTTNKPAFVLNEPRIQIVQRLLDIDENLAAMHARLSGTGTCTLTALFSLSHFL